MPASGSILMFGRDARLLEIRGWVLTAAGYRLQGVTKLSALEEALRAAPFDLLILCHSLSSEENLEALVVACSHVPAVRVLVLSAGMYFHRQALPTEMFATAEGPARLLSKVERLIANQTKIPTLSDCEGLKISQRDGAVSWFNNAEGYGFLRGNEQKIDVHSHGKSMRAQEASLGAFGSIQSAEAPQAVPGHRKV